MLLFLFLLVGIVVAKGPNPIFDRREYALEDPKDDVKQAVFSLDPGRCRPVYITESIDGKHSRRALESQVYTKFESEDYFSISIAGAANSKGSGKDKKQVSASSSFSHPHTKILEASTYWPDCIVCNTNEHAIEFSVQYANGALSQSVVGVLATSLLAFALL
ncbi:MAG: hypothetical protein MHM6MM_004631 [Cercozoa sp. M6MM]